MIKSTKNKQIIKKTFLTIVSCICLFTLFSCNNKKEVKDLEIPTQNEEVKEETKETTKDDSNESKKDDKYDDINENVNHNDESDSKEDENKKDKKRK